MLYHADIFMPRKIRNAVPAKVIRLVYSGHAKRASLQDRYGRLTLPDTIDLGAVQLIEVEKYNAGIVKIVVRVPHCEKLDLCMAIIPGEWLVKTVWANERGDVHNTLDKSRYARLGDVA